MGSREVLFEYSRRLTVGNITRVEMIVSTLRSLLTLGKERKNRGKCVKELSLRSEGCGMRWSHHGVG